MKRLFFISLIALFATTITVAQSGYPAATFNSRTEVILDVNSPLSAHYVADIASLNFSSQQEAESFFNNKTDNLLAYELDYDSQQVIIHFQLQFAPTSWGIADWSQYLNNKLQ